MDRSAQVAGVFEHPNMDGFKCPVCGDNADRPVVLVPIAGTRKGYNCQAEQVHADCLLRTVIYYKEHDAFISGEGRER